VITLKCPDCSRKFKWDTALPYPQDCPLCGAFVGSDRPDTEVCAPHIKLSTGALKSADQVYRQMEAASENRVYQAAELAGCDASDMASLKITDLNDRRDAPQAAVMAPNPVSDFMQQHPNAAGFRGGAGLSYSSAVSAGPEPNSGARMRGVLQQHHAEISHGTAVADRPAEETMAPTYRRRA